MLTADNVIIVSVSQTPTLLGEKNMSTLMMLTDETPAVSITNYGVYLSPSQVKTDWGINSKVYKMAQAVFAQSPNLLAGGGQLYIAPMLTLAAGAINTFSIYNAGSGYAVNDVLTVVQEGGSLGTLTVTEVSSEGQILAATLTTAGSGYAAATDLATTVAPSGGTAATINILTVGTGAESVAAAVTRLAALVYFHGVVSAATIANTDMAALATSIQAEYLKLMFLCSSTYGDVAGAFTTIKAAENKKTRCLYYNGTAEECRYLVAGYASRLLAMNTDGSNTALTMNLKVITGLTYDDTLTQSQVTACKTAGVDVYANIEGLSGILCGDGNDYSDSQFLINWFQGALQTAGFNALRRVGTKVPQTEAGVSIFKTALRRVCDQAVRMGFLGTGIEWQGGEWFGDQEVMAAHMVELGYYIYSTPVNSQSSEDRIARECPVIQIASQQAGALHSGTILVNVVA
jgi:hypothetical protein